MGGSVPLGYDVVNRKLIVNKAEVAQVEYIYKKYLELKSGEQESILDKSIWNSVQEQLKENTLNEAGKKNDVYEYLLKGKVFDEVGNVYN